MKKIAKLFTAIAVVFTAFRVPTLILTMTDVWLCKTFSDVMSEQSATIVTVLTICPKFLWIMGQV